MRDRETLRDTRETITKKIFPHQKAFAYLRLHFLRFCLRDTRETNFSESLFAGLASVTTTTTNNNNNNKETKIKAKAMSAKNESSLVASKASLAFAQLCGNLAQFNAKRFGNDMEKFAKKKTKSDGGENLVEEEDDDDDESSESESSSSSSSSDGESSDGDSSSSSSSSSSSDDDEGDDKISMFGSAKKEKKANAKASKTNHQTEEELANIRRKKYKIRVKGDDSRNVIPAPLESFQDLETTYGCSKSLIKRLEECKWLEPTPIQRQAIPMMLRDVETLAVAPTGSGKTLAFLLPIFMRLGKRKDGGVRAILLAPTKELATQSTRICTLLSDGLR